MNIFAVHENPATAGAALPDKLVVKMPTESLQLLTPWAFNVHGVHTRKPDGTNYGTKGFAHHPCAKWLYESPANVHWLLEHAFGMAVEYWLRYDKYHGVIQGLNQIQTVLYRNHGNENSKDHTPFVLAMPDQYKDPSNPIQSYRNYLLHEKGYAVWKDSNEPDWWDHEIHRPAREKYLAEQENKRLMRKNAKHSRVQTSLQS
jgi:hypothetical protein